MTRGTRASLLCQTLTEVIRLSGCAWPPGWFIHNLGRSQVSGHSAIQPAL